MKHQSGCSGEVAYISRVIMLILHESIVHSLHPLKTLRVHQEITDCPSDSMAEQGCGGRAICRRTALQINH